MREFRRRDLIALGGGLLFGAAACSSDSGAGSTPTASASGPSPAGSTAASSPSAAPSSANPSASTTASGSTQPSASARTPVLPRISAWAPDDNDISPAAKLAAVRVIEAIGTWPSGGDGTAAAVRRVAALGATGSLARKVPDLLGAADSAVVDVLDAQYGGILASSASVLIPVRQWRLRDGRVASGGTTVDVRLRRIGGRWEVTDLHPAAPGRRDPAPSALVEKVLANRRISLPPAAADDVASGKVHDTVLRAMLAVTEDYRIAISVIRSGHPTYVFGTSRLSDHPRGRAFDTWSIDGHAVVDRRTSKSLVTGYMRACAAAGSYNVGGPYQLVGSGTRYFSDNTHHDHVHAGFST